MKTQIVLDPTLSFKSQVENLENYIFIIRNDFNLGDEQVNVMDGCILKFDGGSIANGTIISNDSLIEAPLLKVFSSISFQGSFLNGQIFEIEWFVSQYENSFVINSDKNAAGEISTALACGAQTMRFNNSRYYPISETIRVNGTIDIIGNTRYCDSPSWSGVHQPCIYNTQNSQLTTLFEYIYSNPVIPNKNRVNIEGLNFYCTTETAPNANNEYDSIVKIIHQANPNDAPLALWGLYINININATHNDTRRVSFLNGLEIIASNASITFVEIYGYISTVYRAYKLWKEGNCFITDTKIFGNTYCVRGGDFYGGYPVRNFGSHQPINFFESDNQIAYFNAVQFENYGYVWDINLKDQSTDLYNCRYMARPVEECFLYDGSQSKYAPVGIEVPSDFIYPNLLADNTIKYGSGGNPPFSITTNTVITCRDSSNNEINVEEHLQFKRYKFPKRISRWDSNYLYASMRSDIGYGWNDDSALSYIYNEEIEIKKTNNVGFYQDFPPLYFCPSLSHIDFTLTVEYCSLETVVNEAGVSIVNEVLLDTLVFHKNDVDTYNYGKYIKIANIFYRPNAGQTTGILFTRITYQQRLVGVNLIPRPMFYIPNYHATDIVRGGTELVTLTQYDKGETYYHENYGMLTWDGVTWREQDGASAGVNRYGTFANCPASEKIYVGFKYFCTSNVIINGVTKANIPIFFTGNSWVDSNGYTITSL